MRFCESGRHGLNKSIENETKPKCSDVCDERIPLVTRFSTNTSKVITIMFLCLSMFSVGSGYSLLAPFFPTKAKNKDVSELWIGLIVSQYQIAVIIGSPFFGKIATKINPKTGLSVGLFIAGIGNAFMALIEWIPPGTPCTVLGMIFKTIEGLGAAAVFTNVWTIIFRDFPEMMSKLFATTEMCYGLGMIVGPALGGVLYQLGEEYFNIGFPLPFWCFGTFLVLTSIMIQILVPKKFVDLSAIEGISLLKLMKSIGFTLCIAITINSSLLIGFNEATLDLHLSEIQTLSPSAKGGIFLLFGLTYTIVSQIFGYLGDKIKNSYPLCIIGCLSSMICFIIIGPLPFLSIQKSLRFVIIGQIFLGIGLGGQFIGSFIQGFREIINSGFPEDMSTYAVLAGVFSSAYAIGAAIGPALGGLMLGQMGYQWSTLPLFVIQILMLSLISGYLLTKTLLN